MLTAAIFDSIANIVKLSRPSAASPVDTLRYRVVPPPIINDPAEDGRVPSRDRQHRSDGMHPSGSVGPRGGATVKRCNQNIADRVRGSKSEKWPQLCAFRKLER